MPHVQRAGGVGGYEFEQYPVAAVRFSLAPALSLTVSLARRLLLGAPPARDGDERGARQRPVLDAQAPAREVGATGARWLGLGSP